MVNMNNLHRNLVMFRGINGKKNNNMTLVIHQFTSNLFKNTWSLGQLHKDFRKIMCAVNFRSYNIKAHCSSIKDNHTVGTKAVIVTKNNILNLHRHKCIDLPMNLKIIQVRQASSCAHSLGGTSEEFNRDAEVPRRIMYRSHNCGELNAEHNGLTVTLCAWVVSKQDRFIHLQDDSGRVQAVISTVNDDLYSVVNNCEPGTLVDVMGVVHLKPDSQINQEKKTDNIEVHIVSFNTICLKAETGVQQVDETNVNSFTIRSYNCGQLCEEHIGQMVTLCGWLEFHRVGKFVILRDGYGQTQLIIPEENKHLQKEVDKLPLESILKAEGVVRSRPSGNEQPAMSTGRIEVVLQQITVLNRALSNLPFSLRDFNKAKEPLRLQYRYLDLRYAQMQHNLRTRSQILMNMRDFLVNQAGFVDVETPTLFRPTPGGAQEFVVPTRIPGHFYSLVQSPQQFKQMLMAGAIDRYFQIARCYRDEGARTDRQPEFTQLDIELSFTSVNGVIDLVEKLLKHSWPKSMKPLTIPFKRITYQRAMGLYGSDKPDFSIPIQLTDCTKILRASKNLIVDDGDFDARALVFRKPFTDLSNSVKSKYSSQLASVHPKAKLIQHKFTGQNDNWIKSMSKLLGDSVPKIISEELRLQDDCVLFLAYGSKKDVCSLLGKVRLDFANHLEERGHKVRDQNQKMCFTWIVDFPLFELNDDGVLASTHHPFTAPHPDDVSFIDSDPLKVRSQAYDLVLDGNEVAGGSIRIHNPEQQRYILDKLQITCDTMHHLLDALASGCPPHGGIALGLDRLLAVLLNTNSIRDVIAFPKSLEGRDSLSGAPVPISEYDKKLYHIG